MTSREDTMTPRAMVTPRTSTPLHSSDKEKLLEGKIRELEVDNASLKKQLTSCGSQPSGNSAGLDLLSLPPCVPINIITNLWEL